MHHSQALNHFYQKLDILIEKYDLRKMGIEPCYLDSYESIKTFTQKLLDTLFFEEDYQILAKNEDNSNVEFILNGEKLSFDMDLKHGHIEADFSKKIKLMSFLSGKAVANSNPPGLLISGETANMEKAWNEGLPVHIVAVNFLYFSYNGNRFKRSEIANKFILNKVIDKTTYKETLIKGLNFFLKETGRDIRYTSEQIELYEDYDSSTCILMNGDYVGKFLVENNETEFDYRFLSQVFLLTYFEEKSGQKEIIITTDKGDKFEDLKSFQIFISNLGIKIQD